MLDCKEDLNCNGLVDGTNTCPIPNGDFNSLDDDGNGFIDDLRGWDVLWNDNDPMPVGGLPSADGHEPQVAGIIGAVGNNGVGVAGLCWRVQIMPLRTGYAGLASGIAAALAYAYANGVDVVNMSFASFDLTTDFGYGPNTVVRDAVLEGVANGVLLVAAAGNHQTNRKYYPAAYEEVIGVAATDSRDQRADFSNWGTWVDVAAPGESIRTTTWPGNEYAWASGTSF